MNVTKSIFRLLLGRRLPIASGTLRTPGVTRSAVIRRDSYGIPHIEAEEEVDAWYALGFCQGQDRAFQLELLLRVVRGTLAEISGFERLPFDRLSRRIGFYHTAQRQLEFVGPEDRRNLESFARGVTEGSKLGCRRVAHEFTILRTRPSIYTATDIIAASKFQSFALASNWDIELARLQMLKEDGAEALEALDPTYPEWLPVSVPPGAQAGGAVDRLAQDLKTLGAIASHPGGSNGWALAPSRTATGRAILANDPHLSPMLPPHWYLAHVRTPQWAVAGATFVGAPAFLVGHNDVAAWGVTAGMVDNTDLFLEEIGPDGRSVRESSRFVPCEVREETIRVRGSPNVTEHVVVTPRGPIIGPALDGVGAISLRATWLDPRPVKELLRVHRARTFEEFRHTFEVWPFLSLNMMYADTSGTIGWQLVGEAPKRRMGWGTIPLPGWDPDVGWEDSPIPFDEMPYAVNPAGGILATANNQPTLQGQGPFLGVDWIDGYRAARIFDALEAGEDWDMASVGALQMDQVSLPWRELRDIVLAAPAQSDDARQAMALLETWDGVVADDSPAAAVFECFLAEISRRVAEAKAPRTWAKALGMGFSAVLPYSFLAVRRVGHLVRLLRDQPQGWLGEPWSHVIEDALATVIRTLRKSYGEDSNSWAWGQIRTLTLHHPAGNRPLLGRAFNLGPFPWGGDANTVGQSAPPWDDPLANPLAIASLRMVADVGHWEKCRFSLPGGQSGNPMSPHYDDLLPLWKRGDGVPIAWSPGEVERAARSTLHLLPADDANS